MRHVAFIVAENRRVIEEIAPSFSSAIAKIRRLEPHWVLESSTFEPFESDEKLYAAANALVSKIHSILALYLGRYEEPLRVSAIARLEDSDEILVARFYATLKVNVARPAAEVFKPTPSGSLATAVLSGAGSDAAVAQALALFGHEIPTWARVYDIIEFVGEKSGKVKRTANHYRHLGNPKNPPLPENPPTLAEAGQYAADLLKDWIAARI